MRFVGWAVLALTLGGMLGCTKQAAEPERAPGDGKLILATTLGSAPYSYRDEATGEIVGIDIEIARAAAKRMDCELEIRPMAFSQLLPAVKSGEVDFAAAAITITPSRARDVDFTEPYAYDGSAFLYRTGAPRPTVSRGNVMRVGTQTTSSSQFYLSDHGIDSISYNEYDEALEDFEKGLIDAVFYDAEPIRQTVAKSEGKYAVTPLFTRENYGLAVRKDFPELREALDAVIRERKEAAK